MAAFSDLTFTFRPSRTWSAKIDAVGENYEAVKNNGNITTPQVQIKSAAANAAVGGGDAIASFIQSVTASSSVDVDLQALTDVAQRTGLSFARLKYVEFWLLSAADDATNGTAASSVTVGNASSNANQLFLGGDTMTFNLVNGACLIYCTRSAGGLTVGASDKVVKIANNDASLAAKVQITLVGGTT